MTPAEKTFINRKNNLIEKLRKAISRVDYADDPETVLVEMCAASDALLNLRDECSYLQGYKDGFAEGSPE